MAKCKISFDKVEIMKIIFTCYELLYSFDGCDCGGLGHTVFDEDNIRDEDLDSTIEWCNAEENKDRVEKDLVIFMCEQMKKLTLAERGYLFVLMYAGWDIEDMYNICVHDTCSKYCRCIPVMKEFFNGKELLKELLPYFEED